MSLVRCGAGPDRRCVPSCNRPASTGGDAEGRRLIKAVGLDGMSKSQVARMCQQLDAVIEPFRTRQFDRTPTGARMRRTTECRSVDVLSVT